MEFALEGKTMDRHLCKICGKEIEKSISPSGWSHYKKTCSDECKRKALAHSKGKPSVNKLKEEDVKNQFNNEHKTFEYVSGYSGCESKMIIKCLVCKTTMECGAQILRKKWKIKCLTCDQYNKDIKQEVISKVKQIKQQEVTRCRELKRLAIEDRANGIKVMCHQCGDIFITYHMGRKYCSTICLRRKNNNNRDKRNSIRYMSNGRVDWSITLDKLIERDRGICHICNKNVDMNDYTKRDNDVFIAGNNYPSIDHVKPISKGGVHQWNNVMLAHRYCNSIKRDNDNYIYNNKLNLVTQ
jgi:5-methylcytosine-specific restriction endonuclease McrA